MKKIIFILPVIIILSTSCSSYINKIHQQMDQDTMAGNKTKVNDKFDFYRKSSNSSSNITTNQYRDLPLKIKRNYRPVQVAPKRYTAQDLTDTSDSGSLWAGSGKDGHLFSTERKKQNGDIIVINVYKDLKDKIAVELKRAFPPTPQKKNLTTGEKTAAQPTNENNNATTNPTQPSESEDNNMMIYDRISSIVVEQINDDHLLLRGRKDLIYRKAKRTVELQALVSRNSIATDDTLNSQQILESYVKVIR